jgi:hypothetical protein
MKYAEPRRINEIANQNLTTNQKVGSSSPPGRATSFLDLLLLLPSIPKLQNSLVWIAAAGFLLAVKAVNRQRSGWSLALKAAIQTHENAVQVPTAAGLSRWP